jgi:hypothetical protein
MCVDGDANEFGSCQSERFSLLHRGSNIRRVGIGHRLHGNGVTATDPDAAYVYWDGLPTSNLCHAQLL